MGDRKVSSYSLEPFSGLVTGTGDGSVVTLPPVYGDRIILRPLPSNMAAIGIGRTTGSFGRDSGLQLEPADGPLLLEGLRDLSRLQMFTPTGGYGLSYMVLFDPGSYPLG